MSEKSASREINPLAVMKAWDFDPDRYHVDLATGRVTPKIIPLGDQRPQKKIWWQDQD